jgi:hypothetical protein
MEAIARATLDWQFRVGMAMLTNGGLAGPSLPTEGVAWPLSERT